MLDIAQFRQFVVAPALTLLQMYSKDAEELLVFTCAAESDGGTYIKQVNGPAMGIYQCEPETHFDLWKNFILYRNSIVTQLAMNFGVPRIPEASKLMTDILYSTAICRLHYFRVKEKLPNFGDIDGIWQYYKTHYNTEKGKATKDKAVKAYKAFSKGSSSSKDLLQVQIQ